MPADLELIKDYTGRDYRTVWQGPRAAFEDRFESALIERLVPRNPGWFIDLGAGYGRLHPLYARGERKVVLVDYALNLLEIAAESLSGENVAFVAANAYHLPFRAASFGAGISIRTFHHMAHPERFLGELGRVLRSEASFLLEYSNKRNLLRLLRFGRSALRKDHEEYGDGDLLFGTHPAHLAELSRAAGLTVTRTRGTGFMSRLATERTRTALPLLRGLETALDPVLGAAGLTPINFAVLRKQSGTEDPAPAPELADLLRCPACGGGVERSANGMSCTSCERHYPQVGAVLDLRYVGPR